MRRIFGFALFALIITLFVSCKPKVPSDIIQPSKMEDLLYDYHLAQAVADQDAPNKADYNRRLYFDAVLKKHKVTQAEFDSSMLYYQRHTERLYNIYDNINKRLQNEAGTNSGDGANSKYANLKANSDTALIWKGNTSEFLLASAPFNKMSFYIKADSSYHAGDAFEFSMDVQFIMEDGSRDAVALLAVRYDNDSIATQNIHMSSPSHYTIMIPSFPKHKIKDIRGFVYLSKCGDSKTTLKMMCLSNIMLMKFHQNGKMPVSGAPQMQQNGQSGMPQSRQPGMPQPGQNSVPINQSVPNSESPQRPQNINQNAQGTLPPNSRKRSFSR